VLASDYYYPALLQAPYRLARREILSLGLAWRLVAEHPARAAGLRDRGALEAGRRADLVVVDDLGSLPPRIVRVLRAGREVYRAAS
jgi:alpha-D-ribose 1-methylphosphonate 5-triphosphate diphosphatase